jgi:hypothetical protein
LGSIIRQAKSRKGAVEYLKKTIREIIAVLFWLYVLVKLFIFDVDVFLIDKFLPKYIWLVYYKFYILLATIAVLLLITRKKYILKWLFYILFYPLVLCWKIFLFAFTKPNWIFAFALINSGISLFKSLKYYIITLVIYIGSLFIIFKHSNEGLIWLAISAILLFLIITYIRRFVLIFKPSSIFQAYIKVIPGIQKHGATLFTLDNDIRNLPVEKMDQYQLEEWTNKLQVSVLFNRAYLFLAKKLKDYQNSGLDSAAQALKILLLTLLTIFSFTAINYGLYKIDVSFFAYSNKPIFFTFLYYSFNTLLFNSIKDIVPTMQLSQAISMVESFFAFILITIFVSLLFSSKSQRHTEELNEIIGGLEKQGSGMEGFIRDEYSINSIDDAIEKLEKSKSGLIKIIYKLSDFVE